eukprot:6127774-Amphidinium_carterae.3
MLMYYAFKRLTTTPLVLLTSLMAGKVIIACIPQVAVLVASVFTSDRHGLTSWLRVHAAS